MKKLFQILYYILEFLHHSYGDLLVSCFLLLEQQLNKVGFQNALQYGL